MIISLISIISVKVAINNKLYNSLEYKKEDLYNLEDFEKTLCLVNKYSIENKEIVNDIKNRSMEKDIMDGMNLGYIKETDKFNLIYIDKGFRYETLLRYKEEEGIIIFLPVEQKYINEENLG